jgi:hypothetical protein
MGRLNYKIMNIKALGLNFAYRRQASRQISETSKVINKTGELIKEVLERDLFRYFTVYLQGNS